MEKVFVVKRVGESVRASEESIDAALASASALMSDLITARHELGVSPIVTDAATGKIAQSMKALADARAAMVEAHHALYEAQLRIGVRTKLDGGHSPWDLHEDKPKMVRNAV